MSESELAARSAGSREQRCLRRIAPVTARPRARESPTGAARSRASTRSMATLRRAELRRRWPRGVLKSRAGVRDSESPEARWRILRADRRLSAHAPSWVSQFLPTLRLANGIPPSGPSASLSNCAYPGQLCSLIGRLMVELHWSSGMPGHLTPGVETWLELERFSSGIAARPGSSRLVGSRPDARRAAATPRLSPRRRSRAAPDRGRQVLF